MQHQLAGGSASAGVWLALSGLGSNQPQRIAESHLAYR